MNKVFTDNGWKDYIYWQTEDRKTLKKSTNFKRFLHEHFGIVSMRIDLVVRDKKVT